MENRNKGSGGPLSRRSFFRLAGKTGVAAGAVVATSACEGQPAGGNGWVPEQYNAKGNFPVQVRGRVPIDPANLSIVRDDRKCILCGQCAEACDHVQSVMGHYRLPLIDTIPCVDCGQCSLWCPSAAITERDDSTRLLRAIADKTLHVVVQMAPSTRVALGEDFGLPVGTNVEGQQIAALRKLGVDAVFDTNFSADLTIMEEATELVGRIAGKGRETLPQFTSCCPGWVRFCEMFYPDMIPHLSSAKSPMTMMGAMIKTHYANRKGIDPAKIVSVAIMPCTAKKSEAARPEMNGAGRQLGRPEIRDIDIVLTTRELARMIKAAGIDLTALPPESCDGLLSEYTGAGAIFGNTGGVMEAAVRTAYFLATNRRPPDALLEWQPVRGLKGLKEASVAIPGVGDVRVAIVSGLGNARQILDRVRSGAKPWHFIEVMACPGGCIAGGGQPRSAVPPSDTIRQARSGAIYSVDERATIRLSHENGEIKAVYESYLGRPNSELAHHLLHTGYTDRSMHVATGNRRD